MFKLMSGLHSALFRASRGKIAGRVGKLDILLLTTTGRKTGKARTVPLLYADASGGGFAVIASKGGAAADPAWCVNLRANPAAEVELGGRRIAVTAREAEGDERDRLWREMAAGYKGYDGYREKTSRRIPVFVLEPSEP